MIQNEKMQNFHFGIISNSDTAKIAMQNCTNGDSYYSLIFFMRLWVDETAFSIRQPPEYSFSNMKSRF